MGSLPHQQTEEESIKAGEVASCKISVQKTVLKLRTGIKVHTHDLYVANFSCLERLYMLPDTES